MYMYTYVHAVLSKLFTRFGARARTRRAPAQHDSTRTRRDCFRGKAAHSPSPKGGSDKGDPNNNISYRLNHDF